MYTIGQKIYCINTRYDTNKVSFTDSDGIVWYRDIKNSEERIDEGTIVGIVNCISNGVTWHGSELEPYEIGDVDYVHIKWPNSIDVFTSTDLDNYLDSVRWYFLDKEQAEEVLKNEY